MVARRELVTRRGFIDEEKSLLAERRAAETTAAPARKGRTRTIGKKSRRVSSEKGRKLSRRGDECCRRKGADAAKRTRRTGRLAVPDRAWEECVGS